MFSKDPLLSLSKSAHSPHQIIPNLIKPNSRVLDLGCNAGMLGQVLKNKNVIIDGIDINPKALKVAKKYYHSVIVKDLEDPKLRISGHYDYIVMADILEHLPRPDLLLKNIKKNLSKNGKIIISTPNIARWEIRLGLMFGRFNYSPGILSPDHLRFFTRDSIVKLLEDCEYKVIEVIPTGLGHMIKILPTLTAFQFITISQKHEK